ncbi:hypothetical protein Tco_1111108 [Tanacetum coccineum]|uniref:Uncharacterized protein n=1 Tax=Tanacetum coccineum TaxID=301880 RepID=A0ABQ5IM54_9ASTR
MHHLVLSYHRSYILQFIFEFFANSFFGFGCIRSGHSGSSTRDVPPILCDPLRRAPRCSEAFRRWCDTPLSTLYPPTTSESSSGNSSERPLHSSSHSVRPSRRRCRSSVDSIPSSMAVMASIERITKINPIETKVDMELGISYGDDVRDHVEIDPRDVRDDTEECEDDTNAGDTDCLIETAQRRLEADQLLARGQRVGMIKRIDSLRLDNLKVRAMLDIERDRRTKFISSSPISLFTGGSFRHGSVGSRWILERDLRRFSRVIR